MSTWNHRVVKETYESEHNFEICEVFYDSDGLPYAYGNATVASDKLEELSEQLSWLMDALSKPVLTYPDDFKGDVNK
jgi:hypothetical protein